jgi:hypothetical protein
VALFCQNEPILLRHGSPMIGACRISTFDFGKNKAKFDRLHIIAHAIFLAERTNFIGKRLSVSASQRLRASKLRRLLSGRFLMDDGADPIEVVRRQGHTEPARDRR